MFSRTNTVKFMTQSENGKKEKKPINENLRNFLWGLLSTVAVGGFLFAWNTNATMAQKKEHDALMDKRIDEFMIKLDNIQLDLRDIREKVIHLEDKTIKHE